MHQRTPPQFPAPEPLLCWYLKRRPNSMDTIHKNKCRGVKRTFVDKGTRNTLVSYKWSHFSLRPPFLLMSWWWGTWGWPNWKSVSLFLCKTAFSRQISGRFKALTPGKGVPLPFPFTGGVRLRGEAYMAWRRWGRCVLSYLLSLYPLRCG